MIKKNQRILILIPGKDARGGITAYYKTLAPLFSFQVDYLERGSRKWPQKENIFIRTVRILKDLYRFIEVISSKRYGLVITNTSFSLNSILRDGLFLIIARLYKLKTVVFFHGWDYSFAETTKGLFLKLFKLIYFRSDAIIELAQRNINLLKVWGCEIPIFLETMVVDKNLLKELSEEQITEKFESKNYNLLFLARLEKPKGIYEAIETYEILKNKNKNLKMTIAGDGSEENNIKNYIIGKNLKDIAIIGFVERKAKIAAYNNSHIYLFPSHSEGMPTSVLEAMSFGLPVITRKIGGLPDFFINGEHGFITESKDPEIFYELLVKLIDDCELSKKIAINNFRYSKERFLSNQVVKRVEKIFTGVFANQVL